MQRHALLVLAPLFLLVGLTLTLSDLDNPIWGASAIRIGVFFTALWIAYPHLGRIPQSAWIYVILLGVVIARWRYLLPPAIILMAAIALLRRFGGERPARGDKTNPTTKQ